MDINTFENLVRKAIGPALERGDKDYGYELSCVLQYLIPEVPEQKIFDAIQHYKENYG